MKLKKMTAILTILFGMSSVVHAMIPKPEKCPSVSTIQATSFDIIKQKKNSENGWEAWINSNNFDTNNDWVFMLDIPNANDEKDARAQALEAVKGLRLFEGPEDMWDFWYCSYMNGQGYGAVAVTPSIPPSKAISLIK